MESFFKTYCRQISCEGCRKDYGNCAVHEEAVRRRNGEAERYFLVSAGSNLDCTEIEELIEDKGHEAYSVRELRDVKSLLDWVNLCKERDNQPQDGFDAVFLVGVSGEDAETLIKRLNDLFSSTNSSSIVTIDAVDWAGSITKYLKETRKMPD